MNLIKKFGAMVFSRDSVIIITITFVLLVIINFSLVYFSPSIIKGFSPNKKVTNVISADIVGLLSPCYRTLLHLNRSPKTDASKYEIVFGDSHTEGFGDEFIRGDYDYGIFRM